MVTRDGFSIIGISVRTTNKDNKAAEDIGKLWEQFFADNLSEKIPNKLSSDIYSIYTDYKSNYTEEYTTILGIPVSSLENIPEGLEGRQFEEGGFEVFTAKGQMPKAVADTWIDIWDRDAELQRKYTYDFEVYDEKSQNGDESEVKIFIATNKK